MIRLFFVAAFILAGLAATLGLRACQDREIFRPPARNFAGEVAILGDGTPMFAPNGTIGRVLADWLGNPNSAEHYFEVGGTQFVGRAVDPTPDATARMTRLVAMLKAYPDVTAKIVGFTDASGDPAADQALSARRANRVVELLADQGIARSRLSAEGRGSTDPIASDRDAQARGRNNRIALFLRYPKREAAKAAAQ